MANAFMVAMNGLSLLLDCKKLLMRYKRPRVWLLMRPWFSAWPVSLLSKMDMKTSVYCLLFMIAITALNAHGQTQESRCQELEEILISENDQPVHESIDYILVSKKQRRLIVFRNGQALKEYSISLGFTPIGAKEIEGDGKTPEGIYSVAYRKNPSDYNKSLLLDYPRQKDLDAAKILGARPGSSVAIHGLPVKAQERDRALKYNSKGKNWTRGCMAVTDEEIEEIFPLVRTHTTVEICP